MDDRTHFGADVRIPLTVEQSVEVDDHLELNSLVLCLTQQHDEAVPTVDLHEAEQPGVRLTIGEARQLARALDALANSGVAS